MRRPGQLTLVCCACVLLLWPFSSLWAATVTQIQGTEVTWHTGSATLASNAQVQTATVSLGANAGHLYAYCNLTVPMSAAPAVNTAITAWFRVSTDAGTTFPDGGSAVLTSAPDMVFPLRAVTGTQVVSFRVDRMPVGVFQVLIRNDGTGATINTTWSLKCKTHTLSIN